MRKLLLFFFALLTSVSGAWADVTVTIADASADPYNYGTRSNSNKTFTTNDASGLANVVLDVTGGVDHYSSGTFGGRIALKPSAASTDETWTLTAPDGYLITGYSFSATTTTGSYTYTITTDKEYTISNASYTDVTVSGLKVRTTSFTVNATAINWLAVGPFTVTLTPINFVSLTFDRSGSAVNSVTVNVKDEDGDAIPGVTASLESTSITEFKTGSASALSRTTNSVLAPNSYENAQNSTITYTFKVEGLSGVTYNKAALDVYAMTGGGGAQNNTGDTQREWTFDVATGTTEAGVTTFVNQAGNDICTVTDTDGDLHHKLWTMDGSDETATDVLYIKVTLTKTASLGCYAGISEIRLFRPSYTVTYVVKDESDNTLFTSDPVPTTLGANITTLPAEYQKTYFYNYNNVDVTISETGNTNIEFTATPKSGILQYTADATSPVYYNLNIRSKYLAYNDEATGDVELLDSSTPFNPDAAWAFIGDPYTGFKIINQTNGTDKYLTYTSVVTGGNSGNNNIQFVPAASFTNQYWYVDTNSGGICLRMKENTNIYFHHQNSNPGFLRTCSLSEWAYVHDDAGSTIVFASDEDVLVALYNELKDVIFGDGVGYYTWNGTGTAEQARANISSAGLALDAHATSSYKGLYDALLDIKSNIALNMPAAGFYRIKSVAHNTYLSGDASTADNTRLGLISTPDASCIFYFDGTKLYDLKNGRAANGRAVGTAGAAGLEYTFQASSSVAGQYVLRFNPDGSSLRWLYAWNTGKTDQNGAEDANCRFTLEEVTEIPVTVTAAGYATLYAPVALTIPANMKAYYVSALTETEATLTEITSTIPAETPVILIADANDYTFAITTSSAFDGTNQLSGSVGGVAVAADEAYTLQQNEAGDAVGLFPKDEGTIAGFKAYLSASKLPSSVRGLAFTFEGADGINTVEENTVDNGAIFNLSGQRVQKAQKGLYIVKGKKFIIK